MAGYAGCLVYSNDRAALTVVYECYFDGCYAAVQVLTLVFRKRRQAFDYDIWAKAAHVDWLLRMSLQALIESFERGLASH